MSGIGELADKDMTVYSKRKIDESIRQMETIRVEDLNEIQ